MFVKMFQQIYTSSIANDYQQRLVFMDLLVLADQNGVVDMTHEGIARMTNVPIDIVREAIAVLEAPDPKSRNPEREGRRIMRLDEHRDWGWWIVNYEYYRGLANQQQRREKTLARVRKFRQRQPVINDVTPCNADVTLVTPRRSRSRGRSTDKATKLPATKLSKPQRELANRIEVILGPQWRNDAGKWVNRVVAVRDKSERVIAEVELAARENRIQTTPAQYAEQIWKEFA